MLNTPSDSRYEHVLLQFTHSLPTQLAFFESLLLCLGVYQTMQQATFLLPLNAPPSK